MKNEKKKETARRFEETYNDRRRWKIYSVWIGKTESQTGRQIWAGGSVEKNPHKYI